MMNIKVKKLYFSKFSLKHNKRHLLGGPNSMNMKLMSHFTLLLSEKLVLLFPLSNFPNTILSENEFINLPHRTTCVNHCNLTFRETLQIFLNFFTFLDSILNLYRRNTAGDGGCIASGGGGGRSEEDFRVCLFSRAFF
jgi:hypothetical protein